MGEMIAALSGDAFWLGIRLVIGVLALIGLLGALRISGRILLGTARELRDEVQRLRELIRDWADEIERWRRDERTRTRQ